MRRSSKVSHHNKSTAAVKLKQPMSSLLYLPVLVYPQHCYITSDILFLFFIFQVALENTVRQSAISGANGVVLWDSSSNMKNERQCKRLHRYLNSVLGPYVKSVLDWTERCSRAHCNGHGRCVSLQYMGKPPRKPGQVTIGRGPVIIKVKTSSNSNGHVFDKKNPSSKAAGLKPYDKSTVLDSLSSTRTTNANTLFSIESVTDSNMLTRKTVNDRTAVTEAFTQVPTTESDKLPPTWTTIANILPSAGTEATQRFLEKKIHVTSKMAFTRIIGTQSNSTRSNHTVSIDGSKRTSPTPSVLDNASSSSSPLNLNTPSPSTDRPTTARTYKDTSSTRSTTQVFTDQKQNQVENRNKVRTTVHTIMSTSEWTRPTTIPNTVTNPNQHSRAGHKSEPSDAKSTRWYTTTGASSELGNTQTMSPAFTAVPRLTISEITTQNTDSALDVEHNTPISTVTIREMSGPNSSLLNTITQIIIIIALNILRIFRHSPTNDDEHKLPVQYQSLYKELELQGHRRISVISGDEHSQFSHHAGDGSNGHYKAMLPEEPPPVYLRRKRRVNNSTPKRKWAVFSSLNGSSDLVIEDKADLQLKFNKAQKATGLDFSDGHIVQEKISDSGIPSPESQIVISEGHISKSDHSRTDRNKRPQEKWIEKEFVDFVCTCYAGWTGEFCGEKL